VYGPVLVVPEPAVDERVMTIPGIDGRKMSKS
jgi:tryptophanyl-tRNA synthetase